MTYDEMIEVIQAAKEGKEIEYREKGDSEWLPAIKPCFSFDINDYRVKPEPKYCRLDLRERGTSGLLYVEIKALEDAIMLIDEHSFVDEDWPVFEALKELIK